MFVLQPYSDKLYLVRSITTSAYKYYLQDRNAVVLELLNLLIPARGAVRRGVTPRIVVEGKEVAADCVDTAVHVRGHLVAVRLDISSRVTDGDLAKTASVQVRLDVTGNGLDVRGSAAGRVVVDDLVGGEVEQGVIVFGKHLDGGEDALEVILVVRDLGISSVKGVLRGVDIERKVDASICESLHASVVVGSVVDGVHADSVDCKLLEFGNVALAAICISNGVLSIGRATWLVIDTADVEARIASKESCRVVSIALVLLLGLLVTHHFP